MMKEADNKLQELKDTYKKMSLEKKRVFLGNMKEQISNGRTNAKVHLYNEFIQIYNEEKQQSEIKDNVNKNTNNAVKNNERNNVKNSVKDNVRSNVKGNVKNKAIDNISEKNEASKNKSKVYASVKQMGKEIAEDEKATYTIIKKMMWNNKGKLMVGCIIILGLILYRIIGDGGIPTNPVETCERFIDACIKGDFNKASKLFPYEVSIDAGIYEIHEQFKDQKGKGYTVKVLHGSGIFERSKGEVYYRISFEEGGDYLELSLIREDNKYYVYDTEITNDGMKMWNFYNAW